MRIVIQCAATKSPKATSFRTDDGSDVLFVADPATAPLQPNVAYARPDDSARNGRTWRQLLWEYNTTRSNNPLALLPAYRLYHNRIYQRLVSKFGPSKVFILSAGWGLVNAEFLLPKYDITFSSTAPPFKRRRKLDFYRDFAMLANDSDEVVFVGGKEYLPLFCRLTKEAAFQKIVFFNSSVTPELPFGYKPIRYVTTTRTNWHYECANDLLEERLPAKG
jgi:hypothetical protein